MRHRLDGLMDEPGMQQRPRLDITRKGYRVPHKPRCELNRRNNLFSGFVVRNGGLESSDYTRGNKPHVFVRKVFSWAFPPPKAENEVLWVRRVSACLVLVFLIHEALRIKQVCFRIHLFVPGHRPDVRNYHGVCRNVITSILIIFHRSMRYSEWDGAVPTIDLLDDAFDIGE